DVGWGVGAVLDSVLDAVLVVDDDGLILFANSGIEAVFGYLPSELVGRSVEMLVPSEVRAGHSERRRGYAGHPVARPMGEGVALSAVRKDGSTFLAEISLAPLATPTGAYTTAVVRDVTAQRARLRSEEHLALSQRVARTGSWEHDLTTGEVQWSKEFFALLGIEPGTVVPSLEWFLACVHPDDVPGLRMEIERALALGGRLSADVRLVSPAGSTAVPEDEPVRTVAVLGTVDLDPSGVAVRTVGTVQDITDQRLLERQLRISDERFRIAFDDAPIGMAITNARPGQLGRILKVNPAFCELVGRPESDLLGRRNAEIMLADDIPKVAILQQQLMSGEITTVNDVERLVQRPDGHQLWVDVTAALVRDEHGAPDYFFISQVIDVTERREARIEARQRAERDRRIATVLQADLLPNVPSWVGPVQVATRYQPAGAGQTVGGDWHDVFALPGGRIGLVVGDVAGHGIESAATMTRLRYAARMLATTGASPAGVLTRLNQVVHAAAGPQEELPLVTIVHAQLDLATSVLTYSSAGHMPLLVLPAADPTIERLTWPLPSTGGPPIGVVTDYRYTQLETPLDPGCVLIGFTDGLIERRGESLDEGLLTLLTGLNTLPAHTAAVLESLADQI
ncbi:MAG TPA: PAS domain S-box protein, partial [Kineosporiaceae bacterium]|nr:PAS domain S-box protein [Kineosporiaceae bacterium]